MIHSLKKDLTITLIPQRVRGHQDLTNARLSRLEELNVIADNAARTLAYRIERQRETKPNLSSPLSHWKIAIADTILKKHVRATLRDHILGQRLKDFWVTKGKFTIATIEMIDWDTIRHALKRKPLHHQRWATKFISGFCGSNYKLHQIGSQSSALCPRCQLEDETVAHVLFCQHAQSIMSRRESVRTLDQWMDGTQTRWDIKDTIIGALTSLDPATSLYANVPFNPYDDSIIVAAQRQDEIGLQNFLEGLVCKEWRTIMSHYYQEIKSSRSSQSWAAGLHMQLQLFSRAQWNHRNSVVHARNATGRKLTSENEISTRLQYQLDLGTRYLPTHLHHLANFSVAEALKEPRSKMLSWLHHLETVRPYYEATESREVNTQRFFYLRHWLRN